MALAPRDQLRYWGIAAALFILFIWAMGNTLLPFIIGAAIAYLLDPVADRLERVGMSRVAATALITALAVLVITLFLLIAIPVVLQQIQNLVAAAPVVLGQLQTQLADRFPWLISEGGTLRQALTAIQNSVQENSVALIQALLTSSLAVVDFVLVVVLSPVIAFYLLLDWDRLVGRIDELLPRDHVEIVRDLASQIDAVLSGFVRGQMMVGLILGTFYAVSLALIGLPFGVIIGFFAGLISFIPFVGSILGGITSIGVAIIHFWGEWAMILLVAAVFVFGQAVEGNVLTPKMVGNSVKLHPVWLIFALSAFGAAFGFPGLLIAVPVAAVIGVLSRFGVAQYQSGRLYKGQREDKPASQDAAE